jgi:hypothetical protein
MHHEDHIAPPAPWSIVGQGYNILVKLAPIFIAEKALFI